MLKSEKEKIRFVTRVATTEITLQAIRAVEAAAQFLINLDYSRNDILVSMKHCRLGVTKKRGAERTVKIDGEVVRTHRNLAEIPVVAWITLIEMTTGLTMYGESKIWQVSPDKNFIKLGNFMPGQIIFPEPEFRHAIPGIIDIKTSEPRVNSIDFSHL